MQLPSGAKLQSNPVALARTAQESQSPFSPSARALETYKHGQAWDLMQNVAQRPQYDSEFRPDGVINLSGALNSLMEDWMRRYVEENVTTPQQDIVAGLRYNSIAGTPQLLQAAAGFFNRFFDPSVPVNPGQILATNGITSAIDLLAWTLCDPGDAILYPTPNFYMLDYDLSVRTSIETVPVSTSGFRDLFCAPAATELIHLLDQAATATEARGIRCRLLFLCNPANPEGRCYSSETLAALATWCKERGMHLVVDEVYSMGQFDTANSENHASFSSVLSVPFEEPMQENVHCLYGMSKDFNMGGLRIGFIITRNPTVREAISRVTWFTWITAISAEFVARFLSRLDLVQDYITIYRGRLTEAYKNTAAILRRHNIPFKEAMAGLFVYIDLSQYIHCFLPPVHAGQPSQEIQLCEYLVDRGIFLNPGEFAGSDRPGHFRLVFTEFPDAVELAVQRIRSALDMLGAQ